MKFRTDGIDELCEDFKKVGAQVKRASRPTEHSLSEILNDGFIIANTPFASLNDFRESAGIENDEDFFSTAVNKFIQDSTSFGGSDDMFETAAVELLARKLDENVDW